MMLMSSDVRGNQGRWRYSCWALDCRAKRQQLLDFLQTRTGGCRATTPARGHAWNSAWTAFRAGYTSNFFLSAPWAA
eukprot:7378688-Prymnesium_polylepis.1